MSKTIPLLKIIGEDISSFIRIFVFGFMIVDHGRISGGTSRRSISIPEISQSIGLKKSTNFRFLGNLFVKPYLLVGFTIQFIF